MRKRARDATGWIKRGRSGHGAQESSGGGGGGGGGGG